MLVASGVSYRQLTAPGFETLTGKGIYYGAALTEARSCQDQHVVVIGGANSAGQAAVHFSGYAGSVTMLVRGDSLEKSMSHYLIEQIAALPNIDVRTRRAGDGRRGRRRHLSALRIRDADGERDEDVDAASCSSARRRARTGSRASSRATSAASSSPGADAKAAGWPLKRDPYLLETTCRACSSPATCARARSSASPAPSARARWRSR